MDDAADDAPRLETCLKHIKRRKKDGDAEADYHVLVLEYPMTPPHSCGRYSIVRTSDDKELLIALDAAGIERQGEDFYDDQRVLFEDHRSNFSGYLNYVITRLFKGKKLAEMKKKYKERPQLIEGLNKVHQFGELEEIVDLGRYDGFDGQLYFQDSRMGGMSDRIAEDFYWPIIEYCEKQGLDVDEVTA